MHVSWPAGRTGDDVTALRMRRTAIGEVAL